MYLLVCWPKVQYDICNGRSAMHDTIHALDRLTIYETTI